MTIAIDTSRANKDNKTGTEWYSYYVIQELKKIIPSSKRVILYTNKKLKGDLGDCPANWQTKVLTWLPKYLWTQIRLWWELVVNPPDILFVPAHTIPFLPIPSKIKVIVNVHDVGFKRFPELYKRIQVWYHDLTMRKIKARADVIITISEFSRREIIELYGVDESKIKIVYLGYDQKIKKLKNQEINIFVKYKISQPYLLFVGRIEKKKNVLNMAKAFNAIKDKYPDLKLVLVGSSGNEAADLQQFIVENSLQDRIIMPGYVAEDDLPSIMAGAQVFLFPTLYEGFGLPIVQGMAVGAPVVTSDMDPHREVAGDSALFADPRSAEDLAKKIDQLLSDEELRKDLIEKGLKRVENFSWRKTAEGIAEILMGID